MKPAIIAMLNKKGGVGKTSTCTHLAGAMAHEGKQVLLVDNDPQGSLGRGFFGPEVIDVLPKEKTLAALFDPALRVTPKSLIVPTGFGKLHIIPTNSQHYEPLNVNPPQEAKHDFRALRSFLRPLDRYDAILIDCPPNFYFCSWAALLAADYVIIPTQPEDYGVQGLVDATRVIEGARQYNPGLNLLGYLVSRVNAQWATHRRYEHDLRQVYEGQVLNEVIPMSPYFLSAYEERKPIGYHRPYSPAAMAVRAVSTEIQSRIKRINVHSKAEVIAHG